MAKGEDHGTTEITRTELVWPGKRTQVERVALPFQVGKQRILVKVIDIFGNDTTKLLEVTM